MRRLHFERALLPEGLRSFVSVTVADDGTIAEIGEADPALALRGLAIPGMVNAHAHLEFDRSVPGGDGLPAWVSRQGPRRAVSGAALLATGTAGLAEVTNSGEALGGLGGLRGVIHQELLGIAAAGLPERPLPRVPGFEARFSPHAPYSCSRALLVAALRAPGPPATIHLDEDPAERQFLLDGSGPWAEFLDRLGRDRSGWKPPGLSPTEMLEELGLLGPRLGLVHMVCATGGDLDLVARGGATIVLCPRSNLHIGGRLPDAPGMVHRRIPLALGTDSLASSPDLDLYGEIRTLERAFPQVDPQVWLLAATAGGARLLERPDLGRLAPGARPGIWLTEQRRWAVRPDRAPSAQVQEARA